MSAELIRKAQDDIWAQGCNCGGIGYVTVNAPVGHWAFGVAFHCACRRSEVLEMRMHATMDIEAETLPQDAYGRSWSDFDGAGFAYAQPAVTALRDMVDASTGAGGVMLYGNPGTGKSTLAAIAYLQLMARQRNCAWYSATGLVRRCQSTYANDYEGKSREEIIRTAASAEFLVLDDMGVPRQTSMMTSDHMEVMFMLLDRRYAKRGSLYGLVITTNCTPKEIAAQYDNRVVSRIRGLVRPISMNGTDMRTLTASA